MTYKFLKYENLIEIDIQIDIEIIFLIWYKSCQKTRKNTFFDTICIKNDFYQFWRFVDIEIVFYHICLFIYYLYMIYIYQKKHVSYLTHLYIQIDFYIDLYVICCNLTPQPLKKWLELMYWRCCNINNMNYRYRIIWI